MRLQFLEDCSGDIRFDYRVKCTRESNSNTAFTQHFDYCAMRGIDERKIRETFKGKDICVFCLL